MFILSRTVNISCQFKSMPETIFQFCHRNFIFMSAVFNYVDSHLRYVFQSSPNGAKPFKHWLKVFTGFLERCEVTAAAQEALAPNRLQILFTYVSADVYEHVED